MGFTHYFYRVKELPKETFTLWVEDVTKILNNLPEHSSSAGGYYKDFPLTIRGAKGTGKPTINRYLVSLNGDANSKDEGDSDLAHETFYVPRLYQPESWQTTENGKYFQFCKTARKPYDLAVVACLIRFAYRFGKDVDVSSDGDDVDWEPGLMLCRDLFTEGNYLPFEETPKEEDSF